MTTYWLSFRIHNETRNNRTYEVRREAIESVAENKPGVLAPANRVWDGTTSFLVFQHSASLDRLAGIVKTLIDPAVDVVLIHCMSRSAARIVGLVTDESIFALMLDKDGERYLKAV